MPRKPDPDAGQTTELVFPDDLTDTVFRPREILMHDPDEVSAPNDPPEFGSWVPVEMKWNGSWIDSWIVGLSEIESWLATQAEVGQTYRITRAEKSGTSQTDPYEVNIEKIDQSDQERL